MMSKRNRILLFLVLLSSFIIPSHKAAAGVPVVSEIRVADVTTRSFSVVWISNEAATASLLVYNADCSTPVISVSVESKDNNVIKATAIGLEPATTYCFQTETTSKVTHDITVAPDTPQTVKTESQTTRTYLQNSSILPFGNDLIYQPVYDSNQSLDTGAMLMVSIDGSSYPVSTWSAYQTADGVTLPGALVDLNNVFSSSSRENKNLIGGERMKLLEIRGANGCTLDRWRKVPQDNELVEVKSPALCFNPADLDCNNSVNTLDILRDVSGYGTTATIGCFNSDMDMNGDKKVNILDILYVVSQYGKKP